MKYRHGAKMATAGLAIAVVFAGFAWAQGSADIVKQRLDVMKGFGESYGEIAKVVSGESKDVAGVAASTAAWDAAARKVADLFPAGSGPESGVETRAKPEIWSDQAGFKAAVATLVAATGKLADVAKNGELKVIGAQLDEVGKACGGCHGGPSASGGKFRNERKQ
jgi:cytochrome c556